MSKTKEDNYEFLKDTGINVGPVSEKILNSKTPSIIENFSL